MSFLSGFGSLVAQRGVQAIAAGVLSGAVAGGALVATGIVPVGGTVAPPATIALRACPDAGAKLTDAADGDTLLVTARSADGLWLQVYVGQPGLDRGWLPATALTLDSSGDGLPVAACAAPTPAPLPSPQTSVEPTAEVSTAPTPEPSATPTVTATVTLGPSTGPTPKATVSKTPTPTASHTPTPTASHTPTPTASPTVAPPTAPPDLTPPSITNVTITGAYYDGSGNYYIDNAGNACGTPSSALIRATVTDTGGSGLAGFTVTLHWVDPNGGGHANQMSYNLVTHLYGYTINNQVAWAADTVIQYWITASDNAGNPATTTSPPTNQLWLFKGSCIL
jgi:hypothetical protein